MHEGDAPGDAGAAGASDFKTIEIVESLNGLFGQVPVLKPEIEPMPENMRVHLGLELLFDQRAGRAVGAAADHFDRLAVKGRELRKVAVGNEPGDCPGPGSRHVNLALNQRLGHVQVGK